MINNETMSSAKTAAKTKIIKRYQNRKLYDTQQSCYVTLDDISKMIRAGEDVMVIDNKTKNNITSATLTQIIFESEKKASQYAPLFTLREIIQNGNGSISAYLAKLGAFPKDYMTKQPQPAPAAIFADKASADSLKQNLEARANAGETAHGESSTAKAAAEKATNGTTFSEEETPSLPGSNLSFNP